MKQPIDQIVQGDCLKILPDVLSQSVDLIVTSPPYAEKRSKTYGGIPADKYVEWFLLRSEQFLRVLKPTGSFVLNIKEGVRNGQRQTYVMELVIALQKQGWHWVEEYIWHKRNCFPGKWPNRFRDAWEHCYHFTKQRKFYMDQKAVMVPMGEWAKDRLKKLSETDKTRDPSAVGSGFGKNVSNWIGRDKAYPTNVIHLATECGNKEHSAAFPVGLPKWFISLLAPAGGLVLDPFMGSGTTAVAAKLLGRHFIGTETVLAFCSIANKRVKNVGRS